MYSPDEILKYILYEGYRNKIMQACLILIITLAQTNSIGNFYRPELAKTIRIIVIVINSLCRRCICLSLAHVHASKSERLRYITVATLERYAPVAGAVP